MMQGENDAMNPVDGGAYYTNLQKFVTGTRAALQSYHPSLPIILGVMSTANRNRQVGHTDHAHGTH